MFANGFVNFLADGLRGLGFRVFRNSHTGCLELTDEVGNMVIDISVNQHGYDFKCWIWIWSYGCGSMQEDKFVELQGDLSDPDFDPQDMVWWFLLWESI